MRENVKGAMICLSVAIFGYLCDILVSAHLMCRQLDDVKENIKIRGERFCNTYISTNMYSNVLLVSKRYK